MLTHRFDVVAHSEHQGYVEAERSGRKAVVVTIAVNAAPHRMHAQVDQRQQREVEGQACIECEAGVWLVARDMAYARVREDAGLDDLQESNPPTEHARERLRVVVLASAEPVIAE